MLQGSQGQDLGDGSKEAKPLFLNANHIFFDQVKINYKIYVAAYGGTQLTTFAQTTPTPHQHHTNTTTTPHPHHTNTTPTPHPHHNFFQKVWCWCGVGVVWLWCWCGVGVVLVWCGCGLGEGCQLYATVAACAVSIKVTQSLKQRCYI